MLYLLHYGALSNPLCDLILSQEVGWGNTLLCMYVLVCIYQYIVLFTVVAQDNIFIARPGQYTLYVELPCGVNGTEASTRWQINASSLVSLSELSNGTVAGHNVNGRNIVIEDIMMNDVRNGSRYLCMVLADPISMGYSFILYVAGECNVRLYVINQCNAFSSKAGQLINYFQNSSYQYKFLLGCNYFTVTN